MNTKTAPTYPQVVDVETYGLEGVYDEYVPFADDQFLTELFGGEHAMQELVTYIAKNTEPEDFASEHLTTTSIECPFTPAPVTGQRSMFRDAFDELTYWASRDQAMSVGIWDIGIWDIGAPVGVLGRRDVVSTGPVNDFHLTSLRGTALADVIDEVNRRQQPTGRR